MTGLETQAVNGLTQKRVDGQEHIHLDYFRDKQEAESYFENMKQPYMKTIALEEQPHGYTRSLVIDGQTRRMHHPSKKSAYDRLVIASFALAFPPLLAGGTRHNQVPSNGALSPEGARTTSLSL